MKRSLSMSNTTLGENIRYFMFKYGIYMCLLGKLKNTLLHEACIINKCTSIAIRDLCNARNSNVSIMPDTGYISIMDILCTE